MWALPYLGALRAEALLLEKAFAKWGAHWLGDVCVEVRGELSEAGGRIYSLGLAGAHGTAVDGPLDAREGPLDARLAAMEGRAPL